MRLRKRHQRLELARRFKRNSYVWLPFAAWWW